MILPRAQSMMKATLPDWGFTFIHDAAERGYYLGTKLFEETYYWFWYVFSVLRGDSASIRKIKSIRLINSYSLVGRRGLLNTYDLCVRIENNSIEGCFVECGVARGGCSALMAMVAAANKGGRKSWLFDSFEGLPQPTGKDPKDCGLVQGSCRGMYEEVDWLLFSKLRLDRNNVSLVKGWFQDTLPEYKDRMGAVALLRLDGDWYESTKCCLENLYDNVVPGGYVIIDDYGALTGCKEAVDDFLNERNINVELIDVDHIRFYFLKPDVSVGA